MFFKSNQFRDTMQQALYMARHSGCFGDCEGPLLLQRLRSHPPNKTEHYTPLLSLLYFQGLNVYSVCILI